MFEWNLNLKLNSILTDKEWVDIAEFMENHETIGSKVIEITKAIPIEPPVILAIAEIQKFSEHINNKYKGEPDDRIVAWYAIFDFCIKNGMDTFEEKYKIEESGMDTVLLFIKHLIDSNRSK